jgi:hypothetical protein
MIPASPNLKPSWIPLIRTAGIAAILVILIIPVQIGIFVAWPPPEHAEDFFTLFRQNPLLGLISLDLLYLVNNAVLILFYLGLYTVLARVNPSMMLIALVMGLVGIASYYSSSIAFEMLNLSRQFHAADSPEIRSECLASGRALLAVYKGTAFDVYYVLNAVSLLLMSLVILRSRIFSRATGFWGLASGVLMVIPSTAGTLGLVFSIVSLIPWIGFSILASKKLLTFREE